MHRSYEVGSCDLRSSCVVYTVVVYYRDPAVFDHIRIAEWR